MNGGMEEKKQKRDSTKQFSKRATQSEKREESKTDARPKREVRELELRTHSAEQPGLRKCTRIRPPQVPCMTPGP